MKKLVIAVILVLMIAGITVGVLKWRGIGPFAQQPASGDEGTAASTLGEQPLFVDVPQLLIPVFEGDKVATTVQIQITLETSSEDNKVKVKHLMPRLNDAFLRALYTLVPQLLKKGTQIDVDVVKLRLQSVATKVAGEGVISRVLIQSITDTSAP